MTKPPKCLLKTCENPALLDTSGPWAGSYTVCEWHLAFFRRPVMRCACGTRIIGDAWRYRGGLCSRCWQRTKEARRMRWIAEKAARRAS